MRCPLLLLLLLHTGAPGQRAAAAATACIHAAAAAAAAISMKGGAMGCAEHSAAAGARWDLNGAHFNGGSGEIPTPRPPAPAPARCAREPPPQRCGAAHVFTPRAQAGQGPHDAAPRHARKHRAHHEADKRKDV